MTVQVLGIIAPHPPIMVPEVGGTRAEVTANSADALSRAAFMLHRFKPDTVVLMSPHAPVLADAFVIDSGPRLTGDLGGFGAPGMRITSGGDPELVSAIIAEAEAMGVPVVSRASHAALEPGVLDHGALVPLSFLDREGAYPLVELSLSFLELHTHRILGAAVNRAARSLSRRVAFVASGDCSHRLVPEAPAGFSPRGAEFDALLQRLLTANDYRALEHIDPDLIDAAGECGLRSFITLGGFLKGTGARTSVLSYEGPWGVGYLTAVAEMPDADDRELLPGGGATTTGGADDTAPEQQLAQDRTPVTGRKGGMPGEMESAPVVLARQAIESYVREHRMMAAPCVEGLLATRYGAFVSLHRDGMLRGCIGTIAPTQSSLAEEIVHNAIQAATTDPRFPALGPDELVGLDISVDVLHEPEPATAEDLDPRVYGVIVSRDWRRGLLLPDLDGVDTVTDQLDIARAKAGIGSGESVRIERFSVDRYR